MARHMGVFVVAAALSTAARAAAPPHVVFMLADDLGWNDVGFHGSPQIPTPNIDRLARGGVMLDNYYVNPVCSPTRASLMSGRSMSHHGVQTPYGSGNDASGLNLTYTLLPQQLKLQKNYTAYMVGKWHLGMKSKSYLPSSRGFDKYYGYYLGCSDAWKFYAIGQGLDLHEGGVLLGHAPGEDVPLPHNSGVYTTERYAEVASQWIAEHDQRNPMFMYIAFQGIHSSNNLFVQAPEDYIAGFHDKISPAGETCGQYEIPMTGQCTARAMRKTIAAEVSVIDAAIAQVEAALKAAGMWDNTLLIFSSDNGGPTAGTNNNMANNFPLRSGKGEVWEGGIRAVGFVHGAGVARTGYYNRALHHVSDWYKTILAAAGVDDDDIAVGEKEVPWKAGDGVNNWAAISKGDASARDELLIASQAVGSTVRAHALRRGDMKLVWHPSLTYNMPLWYTPPGLPWNYTDTLTVKCGEPPAKVPAGNACADADHPCLYNITADPCEYDNLAEKLPDVVAAMRARLGEYTKTTVLPWTNFQYTNPAANPAGRDPDTPIQPDPLDVGPHTYKGSWRPWLTEAEAARRYPSNYTGPGY